MTSLDIQNTLRKYKNGEVSKEQLNAWANFVEGRDDIGFEDSWHETLEEVIHRLANPELGYQLNEKFVAELENALETNAL